MDNISKDNLNEADVEFTIVQHDMTDIMNDIGYTNKDDEYLCKTIISHLEHTAAKNIIDYKTVQIPFIGCIRKNIIKKIIRDNAVNFRIARKNMSKDDYRDHVRAVVNDIKEKEAAKEKIKLAIWKLKRTNKKKYDEYAIKLGRAYAELYIYAIYLLDEVPFSQEFEDYYKSLKS